MLIPRSKCSISLLLVLSVTLGGACALSASTEAALREKAAGVVQEDQLRRQLANVRAALDEQLIDWQLHSSFSHLSRRLLALLAEEGTETAAKEAAALRLERLEVAERWIRERPQDVGAYVVLLEHAASEAEVAKVLGRVEAGFGAARGELESIARELEKLGWLRQASALLESYADRRPDDGLVYAVLIDTFERRKADGRAAEWARRWFERLPDDKKALHAYFRFFHRQLGPHQVAELAQRLSDSLTDGNQSGICLDLEKAGALEASARCWQRMLELKPGLRFDEKKSLVRTLAAVGEHGKLVELARKHGQEWQRNAMVELGEAGQCRALDRLVTDLGEPQDLDESQRLYYRQKVVQAMARCGFDGAAGATLALFRDTPADQLVHLLNRRRLLDVETAEVEEVLLERLARQPAESAMHSALANFYRQTGEAEKLLAHAVDWAGHLPLEAEPPLLVAERLLAAGQMEDVAAWIETFIRLESPESWLWDRALEVIERLGETDWARQVAAGLTASADPGLAATGHRHLLRFEREQAGAVERRFGAIREAGQARAADKAAYAASMRAAGRLAELVAAIEAGVVAKSSPGTVELALGREFALYELWHESAAHYALAAERAPDDAQTHVELARVQGKLGNEAEAEQIYRRVLDISPRHRRALEELAFLLQRREDFAAVVDLLGPLAGDLPGTTGLLLGHALMRLERFAEAADQLEKTAWKRPQDYQVQLNLGTAYDRLGRPGDAEKAFRRFLRMTAWSELKTGDCHCSCGLPGQRTLAREWLAEHAE